MFKETFYCVYFDDRKEYVQLLGQNAVAGDLYTVRALEGKWPSQVVDIGADSN
jgi:hypothetical protein